MTAPPAPSVPLVRRSGWNQRNRVILLGHDEGLLSTPCSRSLAIRRTAGGDPNLTPASGVRHERLGRHKEEKVFNELPLVVARLVLCLFERIQPCRKSRNGPT
jgi:hypothetical protein